MFIGVAAYKGKHFAGEHDAILDQAVWEQVQARPCWDVAIKINGLARTVPPERPHY